MSEGESGYPSMQEHIASSKERMNSELPAAYVGSEIVAMVNRQRQKRRVAFGLSTDIDNSFRLKIKEDLDADAKSKQSTFELASVATALDIPIDMVTGNSYHGEHGVLQRIKDGDLPWTALIAGSVGTELWVLHKDKKGVYYYVQDIAFTKAFDTPGSPTYYPRGDVASRASALIQAHATDWGLTFQHAVDKENPWLEKEEGRQPYKTSMYVFADGEEELSTIEKTLIEKFPQQKVVMCEEIGYNQKMLPGDTRKMYCIDVLPVTKADVVNYIQNLLGIDAMVTAGDSGNDKIMLADAGELAVVVGGAKPELANFFAEQTLGAEGSYSLKRIMTPEESDEANQNEPQRYKTKKFVYQTQKGDKGPESIRRGSLLMLRSLRRFGTSEEMKAAAEQIIPNPPNKTIKKVA